MRAAVQVSSAPIQVAPDVALHVLDDEGVFVSEARQELHLFNAPATFVWCGVEEGASPREIAAAYARTLGVDPGEALRLVADLLNQWQALGYVSGVDLPASTIPFTTALGRLLTTPSLRKDFARSPAETARKLSVRAGDLDAVLSLAPDALEAQAEMLAARQAASRRAAEGASAAQVFASVLGGRGTLLEVAARSRLKAWAAPLRQRYYRFLTTTFCLRFAAPEHEATVHPVLAHLETAEPAAIDCVLDIVGGAAGHVVLEDIVPAGGCERLDHLAPLVKARLRQVALDRHRYFLHIHAGVVFNGDRCILLPGAPGRGKTTLTAALSRAGFTYFSDEHALLDEETLYVWPVPVSPALKPGALELIAGYDPSVRDLPVHIREDDQAVRYLGVAPAGAVWERSHPVGWIVFPRYAPGVETSLRPVSKAQALRWLMQECLGLRDVLSKPRVERLVRWIGQTECLELPMSRPADAVELVRARCR